MYNPADSDMSYRNQTKVGPNMHTHPDVAFDIVRHRHEVARVQNPHRHTG